MTQPTARRDDPHPGPAARCASPTATPRRRRVFTFDGLVDGREHLALGLGDRRARGAATGVRRWSARTASA